MPWVKIDDRMPEHPKLASVGPLGLALQVAGLCYCNRHLTDGFVPWATARTLLSWTYLVVDDEGREVVRTIDTSSGMSGQAVDSEHVIDLLLAAGIWEQVPGGYRIHDFADYQPTKAQFEKEQQDKKVAGKAGAAARWNRPGAKQKNGRPDGSRHGSRHGSSIAESCPDPDPDPEPRRKEEPRDAARARTREGSGSGPRPDADPAAPAVSHTVSRETTSTHTVGDGGSGRQSLTTGSGTSQVPQPPEPVDDCPDDDALTALGAIRDRLRTGYAKRYAAARACAPPVHADARDAEAAVTRWVEDTARVQRVEPLLLVDRVLDGFFSSDTAKRFTWRWTCLARDPGEFIGLGPPAAGAAPVRGPVRARRGPAPVSTAAEIEAEIAAGLMSQAGGGVAHGR